MKELVQESICVGVVYTQAMQKKQQSHTHTGGQEVIRRILILSE